MATITLKNVPEDLYEQLKEAAARNRRSLNQEAIFRLAESKAEPHRSRDVPQLIEKIRRFNAKLPPEKRASLEEVDRWKREGRA